MERLLILARVDDDGIVKALVGCWDDNRAKMPKEDSIDDGDIIV